MRWLRSRIAFPGRSASNLRPVPRAEWSSHTGGAQPVRRKENSRGTHAPAECNGAVRDHAVSKSYFEITSYHASCVSPSPECPTNPAAPCECLGQPFRSGRRPAPSPPQSIRSSLERTCRVENRAPEIPTEHPRRETSARAENSAQVSDELRQYAALARESACPSQQPPGQELDPRIGSERPSGAGKRASPGGSKVGESTRACGLTSRDAPSRTPDFKRC